MDGTCSDVALIDAPPATDDDTIARLYAYWQSKRAGRRFPARRDLDPCEFGYMLGWIMLVDVTYDPLRFFVRLYGSELAARAGFDVTGTYIDKHPQPEFRAYVEKAWRETVTRGEVTHGRFNRWVDDRRCRYESLRLPLASDGENIDMLLVAIRHKDRD